MARGLIATLLLGADDAGTPAAPCQALAATIGAVLAQTEVGAGAHHGFDGTAAVRLRR